MTLMLVIIQLVVVDVSVRLGALLITRYESMRTEGPACGFCRHVFSAEKII